MVPKKCINKKNCFTNKKKGFILNINLKNKCSIKYDENAYDKKIFYNVL